MDNQFVYIPNRRGTSYKVPQGILSDPSRFAGPEVPFVGVFGDSHSRFELREEEQSLVLEPPYLIADLPDEPTIIRAFNAAATLVESLGLKLSVAYVEGNPSWNKTLLSIAQKEHWKGYWFYRGRNEIELTDPSVFSWAGKLLQSDYNEYDANSIVEVTAHFDPNRNFPLFFTVEPDIRPYEWDEGDTFKMVLGEGFSRNGGQISAGNWKGTEAELREAFDEIFDGGYFDEGQKVEYEGDFLRK